ncbi:cache domain-containing protein [Neptunomonas antarctica]|uniref:histidine kinase n=1 Tax=Neptunomonas antarctica TaxID=619304 RepID=A0A1N7P0Z9_9GAMM|nr:cache domain-containing protein [Neptunomonas antarctica]SIT04315.1 PAS domain S-box-containing protein [Neptunomonas antarctica]
MLFPSRLVQRFFPIVVIFMVVIFGAVYVYSVPFIKEKVYEIERNSSRIALDNVFTIADRMYADTENYQSQTLDANKERLKIVVSMAESYIAQVFQQIDEGPVEGRMSREEARASVFDMLRHFKSRAGDYIWVASYDDRFLSHPDDRFHGKDVSTLKNSDGVVVLPEIIKVATHQGEGFYQYKWNRLSENTQLDKLSYVKNYPQWGFVMGSGVYLEDVAAELEIKRNKALEELRDSFKQLRVAKTGYLFIFDATTNMLIHPNPNIDGTNIQNLLNPVTHKSIADDLINVADTGKELFYKWDKPEDPGNYIYEKLSLVRHVKGFDWYICSSVYVDELKSSSEQLSDRILTIALLSLLVAVAMAFVFIYWVTNPIKQLADAALRVSKGELTATVGFRRDDELGILAKTFDEMVERVRDNIQNLDLKVKNRTVALEKSNQQLMETVRSREDAQQALTQIEERQRIILDLLPAQVAYFDSELTFQFVNQRYADLLNKSKSEITGKALEVLSQKHYQALLDQLMPALAGIESNREYSYWSEGRESITKRFLTPCRNEAGQVVGVLLVALDITSEKEVEKKLLEAQRMSAVGHLAGGLAHDFNNLLSIILGNLVSASEHYQHDTELQRYIKPSIRAAKRGANITSRLLAFSRRQPLAPLPCDIHLLLEETIELLRGSLPSNIELVFDSAATKGLPFVDPGRLEDALVNLVLNAKEAMPRGGLIEFTVTELSIEEGRIGKESAGKESMILDEPVKAGDYIQITVSDSGQGFTDEAMLMAFEPFFTTSTGGVGTGLGLSMVYGFVKQSNGYIKISNEPVRGAEITLLLPSVLAETLSETTEIRAYESPEWKGKLILLVEDDDDVRQVVRELLIKMGFSVIESSTAEEARELINVLDNIYALVSDIRLNGAANGFDLADNFKLAHPQNRVLLMTGYAFDENSGREGKNHYAIIQKPFDIKKLIDAFQIVYEA